MSFVFGFFQIQIYLISVPFIMVFTQSVPAQAASWRETSALLIATPQELLSRNIPPSQFTNARHRRLFGHGDVCQSVRRESNYAHQQHCECCLTGKVLFKVFKNKTERILYSLRDCSKGESDIFDVGKLKSFKYVQFC